MAQLLGGQSSRVSGTCCSRHRAVWKCTQHAPAPSRMREKTAPVTAAMEAPPMSGLVRSRLSLQQRKLGAVGEWRSPAAEAGGRRRQAPYDQASTRGTQSLKITASSRGLPQTWRSRQA